MAENSQRVLAALENVLGGAVTHQADADEAYSWFFAHCRPFHLTLAKCNFLRSECLAIGYPLRMKELAQRPGGEEMVVLPAREYARMTEALEIAEDVAAFD